MKSVSVIVTDKYSNLVNEKKDCLIFIWDEFRNDNEFISVPKLVEQKASKYRSEFLDWVHFFSETKIDGTTLYNHLKFEDGFPFWWTTSLGQKFNIHNNSQINDVIKSMAFYDYLNENKIEPFLIEVCSEKKALIDFLKSFPEIKKLKINFIPKGGYPKRKKSVFLYALFIFRFVIYNMFTNQSKNSEKTEFVFFDIFTHLRDGKDFKSNYWTKLVDLLKSKYVTWNHIYLRSSQRNSYINSLRRINIFNSNKKEHYHKIIEQDFGFKNYLRTLKMFLKIKKKGIKTIPYLSKSFSCNKRNIDFSPWIRDDFINSIVGQEALKNCYYSLLIKKVVNNSHVDARAFFIQEFQPWEIALVYYWKNTKKKKIIGIPHSTHRYWDLRYFFGKSFFSSYSEEILPDQIAVNGKYSFERCIENGYPRGILKPLEALRYIHHPKIPYKNKLKNKRKVSILICCDYQLKTSEKLIKIVNEFISKEKIKYELNVRMHPSFPLPTKLIRKYNLYISNEEIVPDLQKTDWVITSNLSAIAVDAFYQGCNIAQLSDGLFFNLSPLRGVIDSLLFTDSIELKEMIRKTDKSPKSYEYFFIDPKLKLWRKFLLDM